MNRVDLITLAKELKSHFSAKETATFRLRKVNTEFEIIPQGSHNFVKITVAIVFEDLEAPDWRRYPNERFYSDIEMFSTEKCIKHFNNRFFYVKEGRNEKV